MFSLFQGNINANLTFAVNTILNLSDKRNIKRKSRIVFTSDLHEVSKPASQVRFFPPPSFLNRVLGDISPQQDTATVPRANSYGFCTQLKFSLLRAIIAFNSHDYFNR